MNSLLSTLLTLAMLAVVATAIYFCGLKVLLLVPTSIGFLVVGVLTSVLLWDVAHGQYQDSDTIIFGLPRVAGSADSWYGPVSSVLGLLLLLGFVAVATFALWPKRRPTPEFVARRLADRTTDR
jgi:nitrogen fixation-related uncharacterized protein